jgi:alkanesulfonate monooxygenase SsuD/methylene tetrahydromethanopterin reductase-like flavin-dependent oxidoreductase (luciferase family)
MRTGIILPTFRDTPDEAFAAAQLAVAAGVDGLFCYDHIWPMGQPERPALAPFPLLGHLAATLPAPEASGGGPFLGTLVARVGLVPNDVLLSQFTALHHLAPGRIIAGLGTGDRLSEAENRAYGIPFAPAAERRADMVELARRVGQLGVTVWVAGGSSGRITEARQAGVALNLWDADAALVTARSQEPDPVEVTWGGPPPASDDDLRRTVRALARAGATWAVFGWPVDPGALASAAREAGTAPDA